MTCLLNSVCASVTIESFSERLYILQTQKKKNFSFKIKADHLKELLINKAFLKMGTDFYGKFELKKNKPSLKIIGLDKSHSTIAEKVKKSFLQKVNIVHGKNLADWLKSHTFVKKTNDYYIYKDESGLLETAEIKVIIKSNQLTIIEKKPTGTLKTLYNYKRYPWSAGKLALFSVKREIYEGNQSIIVENKINYTGTANHGWLPGSLVSHVVQKVNTGSDSVVKRKLEENYQFGEYRFE